MVDSPAYRLNHEEVIKALEEGIAFAENLNPIEAVPDERGAVSAMVFAREGAARAARRTAQAGRDEARSRCRRGRCSSPPARRRTSPTRRKRPDTFQLDAKKKFFQPHRVERNGDGRFQLVAGSPTASSPRTTHGGRFVSYYGDNHPRYAGNVVKAMASAKDGLSAGRRSCSRDELAALDRRARRERDAAWQRLVRGSTTS